MLYFLDVALRFFSWNRTVESLMELYVSN